jgi:diaminopropionate ammonia-lyase
MRILINDRPAPVTGLADAPAPSLDAAAVAALLARCPAAAETPLADSAALARNADVAKVLVKDERGRMGLGSFKALGAAYVIARNAVAARPDDPAGALSGHTYVAASAGNHGLSVAAGAQVFGARAVIFLSETVPESFAARLRAKGADVRRAGADYAASMDAAMTAAEEEGWTLLSDSSWPGYFDIPFRVMEGYLAMAEEAVRQVGTPPSHILLQAGVGGLAGAVAALARARWGATPRIVVVEPEAAPALCESVAAGHPVTAPGPVSSMGRLDCKDPSLIALRGLAQDADAFVTLTEQEAADAMPLLEAAGLATTPSGGAGLAALLATDAATRETLGLTNDSRVLAFLSEEPEP